MYERALNAFKAYDLRGRLGHDMDEDVAYRLGRAAAEQYNAKAVVIGWDARETSESLASAVMRGVTDAGTEAWNIGLAGTEEMYCATATLVACLGIEVTASHNPIDYNGMKIVGAGDCPFDLAFDFKALKRRAEAAAWQPVGRVGKILDKSGEARRLYVDKVLSFIEIDNLKHLKILINSGNGAAGPTFDAIADQLRERGAPLVFSLCRHDPDPSFPNGIPNPLLPENHAATAEAVRATGAVFGIFGEPLRRR